MLRDSGGQRKRCERWSGVGVRERRGGFNTEKGATHCSVYWRGESKGRRKQRYKKRRGKEPLHCRHFGAQQISSLTHDVFHVSPIPLLHFLFFHAFSLPCFHSASYHLTHPSQPAAHHAPYMHASTARLFCPFLPPPPFFHLATCGESAAVAPAFTAFPDRCRNLTKNSRFNWPRPLVTSGLVPLLLVFPAFFSRLMNNKSSQPSSDDCHSTQAMRYNEQQIISITLSCAKCPQETIILISFSVGVPVSRSSFFLLVS